MLTSVGVTGCFTTLLNISWAIVSGVGSVCWSDVLCFSGCITFYVKYQALTNSLYLERRLKKTVPPCFQEHVL